MARPMHRQNIPMITNPLTEEYKRKEIQRRRVGTFFGEEKHLEREK